MNKTKVVKTSFFVLWAMVFSIAHSGCSLTNKPPTNLPTSTRYVLITGPLDYEHMRGSLYFADQNGTLISTNKVAGLHRAMLAYTRKNLYFADEKSDYWLNTKLDAFPRPKPGGEHHALYLAPDNSSWISIINSGFSSQYSRNYETFLTTLIPEREPRTVALDGMLMASASCGKRIAGVLETPSTGTIEDAIVDPETGTLRTFTKKKKEQSDHSYTTIWGTGSCYQNSFVYPLWERKERLSPQLYAANLVLVDENGNQTLVPMQRSDIEKQVKVKPPRTAPPDVGAQSTTIVGERFYWQNQDYIFSIPLTGGEVRLEIDLQEISGTELPWVTLRGDEVHFVYRANNKLRFEKRSLIEIRKPKASIELNFTMKNWEYLSDLIEISD